ncbi:hypothetical protein [Streptomyces sp. NPDC059994]|uniref:hypothetical protein n=1 Tax=Streptomyces sp. NPDC059994 TaxID=3347029 RepID=UPI0036989668
MVDLSPERGPDGLDGYGLTASEDAMTVGARIPDTGYRDESLAELWQFPAASPTGEGVRGERMSSNRGEQLPAAAASGRQVVWLDAATGISDVVTRTRPAGRCA